LRPPVKFGAQSDQLDIDWKNLRVEGGSVSEGQRYLPKLLAVMEHAQKSRRFYPNLSHRHYGAAVEMDNGVEAIGTNVEASRQAVQCDLRYATTAAFNQSVAMQPTGLAEAPPLPKVKNVFLVNADFQGDRPVPCSDCQEWMGSRFYAPNTKVVSLERSGENAPLVRIRTVADMLRFHIGRPAPVRMTTEQPIKKLLINISPRAKQALQEKKLSGPEMQKMVQQAQKAYLQNENAAADSGLKTGVCVKVGSKLYSRGRFDWSTRWFEPADLRAASDGIEASEPKENQSKWRSSRWVPGVIKIWLQKSPPKPILHALAYYGDDSSQPALPSLGRLARHRGSAQTLVLTVENDAIQCRTIADFMPEMYQTRGK